MTEDMNTMGEKRRILAGRMIYRKNSSLGLLGGL
jgi:hypothetical protein